MLFLYLSIHRHAWPIVLTLQGCHFTFPQMDSEDNWQQDCDLKWILGDGYMYYSVCVCVRVKQTERRRFVMLTLMVFMIPPVCVFVY